MKNEIKILDVTLRDGSYAVNFSFTEQDTAAICRTLEEAGVEYIEVGHGVGLGANGAVYGNARATDEEYMRAARGALTKAKYGMFCIAGIASLDHIDLAKKYDMGFIRIGTNVTEVEQSEALIKKAKREGLLVAANYMKSYALPPGEFAEKVLLSATYGADIVYIVDSAGSMTEQDLRTYVAAIRKVSDIPLGFHGHDNLGLAIANSLEAAALGITFIDASLQGLGRSAGNACTEVLTAAFMKKGYTLPLDLFKLLSAGQEYIRPLLLSPGRAPLDIVCGLAEFHSSYMPHIQKYSAKYNVDPGQLILEVTKVDKVNLDTQVLERIARTLPKTTADHIGKHGFNRYVGGEQDDHKK